MKMSMFVFITAVGCENQSKTENTAHTGSEQDVNISGRKYKDKTSHQFKFIHVMAKHS